MTKDKEEVSAIRWLNRQRRKKTRISWFRECSRTEREWLQQVADAYKEKLSRQRLHPFTLTTYYDDDEDKLISAFACLLLNDSATLLLQTQDMYAKLTASPQTWFNKRAFVELSHGDMQNISLKGYVHTKNWMIAALMNELWMWKNDYADNVDFDELPFRIPEYRQRLLRLVLGTSDGIGIDLWPMAPHEILCPVNNAIKDFLHMWFPDYTGAMSDDEAVQAFGLRHEYDMYYAYLGFKELMKTDARTGLSKAVRSFGTRYRNGTKIPRCHIKLKLPEIRFE